MADVLRVALAGLGTVGGGVIRVLDANRELIARRAGKPIEVVAVSARDRSKDRGVDVTRFAWVDDTAALAEHDADVVVELIGGADGPALTLARADARGGQGAGHREQGDAGAPRARTGGGRRACGRRAQVRGGGRGRGAGDQGAARRRGGERDRARLRHPQRHLQFHPVEDGGGRPRLRRGARRGAGAGLCRGGPDVRHRRGRRRAQAVDPRQHRLRDAARVRRGRGERHSPRHRRRYRRGQRRWATASGCWVSPRRGPVGCSSGSTRIWCRRPPALARHRLDQRGGGGGEFRRPVAVPGRRRRRRSDRERGRRRPDRHRARRIRAALCDAGRLARPDGAGGQRRATGAGVSSLHRRRPGRRARRDRGGDARRRRVDREPDPARGEPRTAACWWRS